MTAVHQLWLSRGDRRQRRSDSTRWLAWPAVLAAGALALGCWPAPTQGQQPEVVRPVPPAEGPLAERPAAEPAATLALADLEQLAWRTNPTLARWQALVAAAQGNWVQVGLPNNPAVGYSGQQLGSGGLAEQHALLVEHEIITGGKRRLNRQVAAQEWAQAEQRLAAQQQRVLTDVRLAFYQALLAQRRLQLAEQLVGIARQGQEAAERLQRAGETSRVDLLQAQVETESAEIVRNAAQNRHMAAWQGLTAVVGVPQMPPAILRGELEGPAADLAWDQTLSRLLATSPEVAEAMAAVERARWAIVRARAEPIPNLQLQAGVMQDNGIDGKTDGLVQLLLPLPVFNRNQGAIRQAESEAVAAERALQQVELDLQNRLAPVYERYTSAAFQARRYRERILPVAQQSLDLIRRGYEAGEFPFLQLLYAQRTLFQTNLQYLDAIGELQAATAEIDGLLLRDSLSAAP